MKTKVNATEPQGLRLEPDARRAHLLAIGTAAFGANAYDDVQIEQIARLAGVSRGLLYHYFPSKRDFFAAIIEQGYQDILTVTRPDPSLAPQVQLMQGLTAYLDYVERNPHMYRALFRSAASADPSIRQVVQGNLDTQARRLVSGLGALPCPEALTYQAVRSWLAFLVQTALDWLDWLDRPETMTRPQLLAMCVGALQGALAGAVESAQRPPDG